VRDASHVDDVIEYTDIIQIGAKAMYDHGILRRCGEARKPVLLKRGFGSTLQEFVQAAEFILSGGNDEVILCERGIRTFETNTRFTLDLCGVAFLKEKTNLPVILDPSHAMGYAYGVPDLARACVAMGIEGLLIESHPTPKEAWSDAAQQLNFDEYAELLASLKSVAQAVGRKLV
jgi:3-deoxy-7-phosphoheptulonate synthase